MLSLLVPLYYVLSESRRLWYRLGWRRPVRLPAYVVSVGNLTVGGTGKTSVAGYLASFYARAGRRVAVVSHGYRGDRGGLVVSDGRGILARVEQSGDDALLLARQLPGIPVLSGRRREELARRAVREFGAEVVILDDAFHYFRLARDLDILVFNALAGLGNGRLLPAGPLREPLRNIRRADLLWFNQADLVPESELKRFQSSLAVWAPAARRVTSSAVFTCFSRLDGSDLPVSELSGMRVWVLAGIGAPDGFLQRLERLGLNQAGRSLYPDHHAYRKEELLALPWNDFDCLVTTAKDLVRLPPGPWPRPVVYPKLELKVKGFPDADNSGH